MQRGPTYFLVLRAELYLFYIILKVNLKLQSYFNVFLFLGFIIIIISFSICSLCC